MLLLHPFMPPALWGCKKYFDLTVSKLYVGQKDKLRCSFLAILDHLKAKLFANENLGINGLISPQTIMCL